MGVSLDFPNAAVEIVQMATDSVNARRKVHVHVDRWN